MRRVILLTLAALLLGWVGTVSADAATVRVFFLQGERFSPVDREQANGGIVGPQTATALQTASAPQPEVRGGGRRVEIHRAKGVVLLIDNGRTVRAIHTSTGQGGDDADLGTPPGSFRISRKEQRSWSIPFKTWLPYAAYWDRGWALHGCPDVPAQPASHGCARLPLPEAPIVYAFVSIGTPVRVF